MPVSDEVVWTEEGREALARERRCGVLLQREDADPRLHALVASAVERCAPAWDVGLARAGLEGRAAVAFVRAQLAAGALPAGATDEQAAWAVGLLGAVGDLTGPLAEQIVRRGPRFAVDVLVRAWTMRVECVQPRGLFSEVDMAIWLAPVAVDDPARYAAFQDGKVRLAYYLLATGRADDAVRTALHDAALDRWADAPPHVRAALAVAIGDPALAEEVAAALVADRAERGWFPMHHLPYLVRDPKLVKAMLARGYGQVDLRILENLGAAALPLFEAALAKAHDATDLLQRLYNVRGPKTARLMGRFAERRPYGTLVNNYFATSPELLLGLRKVRSMDPYRTQLARLESFLRIGR